MRRRLHYCVFDDLIHNSTIQLQLNLVMQVQNNKIENCVNDLLKMQALVDY